jgi:hypothetical protein
MARWKRASSCKIYHLSCPAGVLPPTLPCLPCQVYYYSSLSSVLSCALSGEHALVLRDIQGVSTNNTYHAAQGVSCFGVVEDGHLIVTGTAEGQR